MLCAALAGPGFEPTKPNLDQAVDDLVRLDDNLVRLVADPNTVAKNPARHFVDRLPFVASFRGSTSFQS